MAKNTNSFTIEAIKYNLGEVRINVAKEFPEAAASGLLDKTGIAHVYKTEYDLVDFSAKPLQELLKQTNEQINCLITVTQSHNFFLPGLSSFILSKLDLSKDIYCLDINQGCSGFAHALYLAEKLIEVHPRIVILCADKYRSKLISSDRSTNAVFSDCSTATLIRKGSGIQIKSAKHSFDGKKWDYLYQSIDNSVNGGYLHMSGADLWGYTRSIILPEIKQIVESSNIENLYIHQASKLVFDGISESLKGFVKNIPSNFSEFGNTVSSSIPLLLKDRLNEINKGKSLIAGFGVGLNSMLLELEPS